MAVICSGGNKLSGSIKCRGISSLAEDFVVSQEGLCSMELLSYFTYIVHTATVPYSHEAFCFSYEDQTSKAA
jgi:hypothetical protein